MSSPFSYLLHYPQREQRFVGDSGEKLHFSVDVPRANQRLRELIIYISKRCAHDPHFGAVKLNKILYHADFRAYERFGVPLTGVRYFRLPKGPAPRALMPIRRELESEGAIRVVKEERYGLTQHRTVALREPVLEHFMKDELAIVDEVIDELWPQTAREASNASHDVRWRVLQDQDDLPYEFASLSDEPITDAEIQRTRELAEKLGWSR